MPLFITGHIVYGIVGAIFHKDILWVIHKMPYRTLEHVYGKGSLFHFVDQLNLHSRIAFIWVNGGKFSVLSCFFIQKTS